MPIAVQLPPEFRADTRLVGAWQRFVEQHRRVGEAIAAQLADGDEVFEVQLANGEIVGTIQAREFARRYGRVNWTVMSFETMNDGLGATVNRFERQGGAQQWVGADARILPGGITAFDGHGDAGHVYLALHETAHTTPLGIQMNQACWDAHNRERPVPAWGQSNRWWIRNEKTANNITRIIAERLALPFLQNPGASFDGTGGDLDMIYLDELALMCGCGGPVPRAETSSNQSE